MRPPPCGTQRPFSPLPLAGEGPGERACPSEHRLGDALAQRRRRAEPVRGGLRALEVQLRLELPGEADAAVQLDRLAGAVEERLGCQRLGTRAFQGVTR